MEIGDQRIQHLNYVGVRPGRTGTCAGSIPAGSKGAVPFLLLRRCNVYWVSKNIGWRKARKSAVLLGFCGFLTLNYLNSFLGVLGAKMRKKALLGPNFCKSLRGENANKNAKNMHIMSNLYTQER